MSALRKGKSSYCVAEGQQSALSGNEAHWNSFKPESVQGRFWNVLIVRLWRAHPSYSVSIVHGDLIATAASSVTRDAPFLDCMGGRALPMETSSLL